MKHRIILPFLCTSLFFLFSCHNDATISIETFPEVEALISKMSIEEKVGQTAQLTLDALTLGPAKYKSSEPITLDKALVEKAINEYHLGSVLNTANNKARSVEKWHEIVSGLQKAAHLNANAIPILYGVDAIHGATYTVGATFFPQQIAQAATWNPTLVYEAARITAYETRASSIRWNFSPVLDLGKDPRWARMWETYGEDPYLCSVMGIQAVKGYQGEDLSSTTSVAACLKHFLAYGSNSGKDRTPIELSEVALREYYLPAFQASVEAGAASIMINSGLINGTPVHANKDILTGLLKEEMGFEGLVVTDWADIENLHYRDRVASTHKEAIKMSFNAGIDLSMIPNDFERYCDNLIALVKEGEVSMERLDDAVRRILNLKYKLGLFGEPTHYSNYPEFGSNAFEKAAYNTASEAITLLKNKNNILPLKKGQRFLITGPNANSMRTLNGGWTYSWQGEKTALFAQDYNTIFEAMQNEFGKDKVSHFSGVEYDMTQGFKGETNIDINGAVRAAKRADVIVLCLGENSYTEKPGDLNDLMVSKNQEDLALALAKTGKPIVLVLNEGRPLIIRNFEKEMGAVVQTYLSGNFAGDALADILSGDVNPSGKLPYTYPMYSNSLVAYNHKPSEESTTPEGMYDYSGGFSPQYEFGYGLSYTSFVYSEIEISKDIFSENENVIVSVKIKNTGKVSGKEVVQLYSTDLYASITPDMKRLRAFEKIELAPNEERTVNFSINAQDLSFINAQGLRVCEEGDFELSIADLQVKVKYEE